MLREKYSRLQLGDEGLCLSYLSTAGYLGALKGELHRVRAKAAGRGMREGFEQRAEGVGSSGNPREVRDNGVCERT
jgi:hypothetical protein